MPSSTPCRTFIAVLAAFLTTGAAARPTDPTSRPVAKRALPRSVKVGDTVESANEAILASGAKRITRSVGIICYGASRSEWYELADGTALNLNGLKGDGGADVVADLTLGEQGRGYGDKLKWLDQQTRTVYEVELPRRPLLQVITSLVRLGRD